MDASTHEDMEHRATRLEAAHPNWIVLWGRYSQELVAFPRFTVPPRTYVAARQQPALEERMHAVEAQAAASTAAASVPAASAPAASSPVAGLHAQEAA